MIDQMKGLGDIKSHANYLDLDEGVEKLTKALFQITLLPLPVNFSELINCALRPMEQLIHSDDILRATPIH